MLRAMRTAESRFLEVVLNGVCIGKNAFVNA